MAIFEPKNTSAKDLQTDLLDSRDDTFSPFLFVETHFSRKREPIFLLALLENRREIKLEDALKNASLDHLAVVLPPIISEHYQKQEDGKLAIWGKIHSYKFFYRHNEALEFDARGSLIGIIQEPLPDRAQSDLADNYQLVDHATQRLWD